MDGTKITRQRDGRMESNMVGRKIILPSDGWHKINWPKGWTDGELNDQHENNPPKRWTKRIVK